MPRHTVGMSVAVCYDGKWTRAVEAKIVGLGPPNKHKQPKWIKVRFLPWANEEAGFVEMLFKPNLSRGFYEGYLVGGGENGIMRMLGVKGDYYNLWPMRDIFKAQYKVGAFDRPVPNDDEMTSTAIVRKLRTIGGEFNADLSG
jgi:hypothetical protein